MRLLLDEMHAPATAAGRALVTENVSDYSVLAATRAVADEPHAGLIFTNPSRFNRAAVAYPRDLTAALRTFLDNPPVSGESWIWWLEVECTGFSR